MWLGVKSRTGEHVIGTPKGTVKTFSVKRKPEEERWNMEEINKIEGTPGRPKPVKKDTRIPVRIREVEGLDMKVPTDQRVQAEKSVPQKI